MDTRIDIHLNLHTGVRKDLLDVTLLEVLGPSKYRDILVANSLDPRHGLDAITSALKALLLK